MTTTANPPDDLQQALHAAKSAGARMATLPGEQRRTLLLQLADALENPATIAQVMAANRADVAAAQAQVEAGTLRQALANRLPLREDKLATLRDGLRQLAAQEDLLGKLQVHRLLDEGLELKRVTCPLGVVAVIFESRPDALVQIAGLCLRTGNAAVLKGGKEAKQSNRALAQVIWNVLENEPASQRCSLKKTTSIW